ncbi:MAG: hypothetical protein U0235_30085 [Polyangiaceae bacterium]
MVKRLCLAAVAACALVACSDSKEEGPSTGEEQQALGGKIQTCPPGYTEVIVYDNGDPKTSCRPTRLP